jgi:hypothetical protein
MLDITFYSDFFRNAIVISIPALNQEREEIIKHIARIL